MSVVLSPIASGEHIVNNAKYIKVIPQGIEKLAEEVIRGIDNGSICIENFSQHELHPKPTDAHAVEWIFVVDTLNFCFWTPTDDTKYKVNGYTGYFALCAAINRAMEEGVDLTNAAVYAHIDMDTLKRVFRSDDGNTEIPLLEQRLQCLQEVGSKLLQNWSGKFENVVLKAENSAKRLLQLIVDEFPCFRDEANFAGKRVALYKRAQILIGDLWACFCAEKFGNFQDLENISMFADYRVPQVLAHFGCLSYTDELLATLKADEILNNGEAREVEIRGASIYIVEQVKKMVLAKFAEIKETKIINSILIDHFLWDYRRRHAAELEHIPFHKVLSIYY